MRRTITRPVTVAGIGIHSGEPAEVTLSPADSGGIRFQLADERQTEIPARAAFVVETTRCTVLGRSGRRIATVEHLLSALAGLGITDLVIHVSGGELPIGDGSALLWTDAIQSVGMELRNDDGDSPLFLRSPVFATGKRDEVISGVPAPELRIAVVLDFAHPLIQLQTAMFAPAQGDRYLGEIAPARTFGFIEEIEALQAAGLARGGSIENAVVIYPDRFSTELRFANELARHKLLDFMGDLLLACGSVPTGSYFAVKPSHRLNTAFAAQVAHMFA